MLALAFLVLIGVALVAEGFDFHFPRGYIYFAMGFAAAVEAFNVMASRKRRRNKAIRRLKCLCFSSPVRAAASAPRPQGSRRRAATTSA